MRVYLEMIPRQFAAARIMTPAARTRRDQISLRVDRPQHRCRTAVGLFDEGAEIVDVEAGPLSEGTGALVVSLPRSLAIFGGFYAERTIRNSLPSRICQILRPERTRSLPPEPLFELPRLRFRRVTSVGSSIPNDARLEIELHAQLELPRTTLHRPADAAESG